MIFKSSFSETDTFIKHLVTIRYTRNTRFTVEIDCVLYRVHFTERKAKGKASLIKITAWQWCLHKKQCNSCIYIDFIADKGKHSLLTRATLLVIHRVSYISSRCS